MSCLIFYVLLSAIVTAQSPPNPCSSKPNCHECIQTPSCAWCYDPVSIIIILLLYFLRNILFQSYNYTRCLLPSVAAQQKIECPEEFTLNPDVVYSKLQDLELSKAHRRTGEGGGQLVSGYEGNWNYSESFSGSGSDYYAAGGGGGSAAAGGGNIVQVKPQRVKLQLRASRY